MVGNPQSAPAPFWLLYRPLGLVSITLKVHDDHKRQPSIAPRLAEEFTTSTCGRERNWLNHLE